MVRISYWILPLLSGTTWLITLITLLIYWTAISRPKYPSMSDDQSIAFISDVGAYRLKPLFVLGSILTSLLLTSSLVIDHWLRAKGRLARNVSRVGGWLSWGSMVFGFAGTVGLIGLAGFDTFNYKQLHRVFLAIFVGGWIFSATCTVAFYQRLGIHFREHSYLRASFWIKLSFIITELILAIAFAVTLVGVEGTKDVAAVLEWALAFIFSFYVFSFILDLLPAAVKSAANAEAAAEVEAQTAEGQRSTTTATRQNSEGSIPITAAGNEKVGSAPNDTPPAKGRWDMLKRKGLFLVSKN